MKLALLVIVSLSVFLFSCSHEMNNDLNEQHLTLQTEWKLVSIDDQLITANSSIKIDKQGKATGKLACNNFFGTLQLQANVLRIDKMGSTRRMCITNLNTIEKSVKKTLSTWSKVQIVDKKLILSGAEHTLIYIIK